MFTSNERFKLTRFLSFLITPSATFQVLGKLLKKHSLTFDMLGKYDCSSGSTVEYFLLSVARNSPQFEWLDSSIYSISGCLPYTDRHDYGTLISKETNKDIIHANWESAF